MKIKSQMAEKVELMKLAFEILKTQSPNAPITSESVKLVYQGLYGALGSLEDDK